MAQNKLYILQKHIEQNKFWVSFIFSFQHKSFIYVKNQENAFLVTNFKNNILNSIHDTVHILG